MREREGGGGEREREREIQMVYLTWASAPINIHNTVHKNNVHITERQTDRDRQTG